jgi:hypothetical protein
MRAAAILAILASGTCVFGATADHGRARKVTVCMGGEADLPAASFSLAENTASGIFSPIGVRLRWHDGPSCASSTDEIRIDLANQAPEGMPADALAYAYPYEGAHIVVIYDRVKRLDCGCAKNPALGYVLAHEIAHILQGITRHSESGVMKAHWDRADYEKMLNHDLHFAPEDIALIDLGLKARAARQALPLANSR